MAMISSRRVFIVYFSLLLAAILWNLAIVMAPWTWAHGATGVASILYSLFSPLCHQRADRSFFWVGHHFAACQRCTGIYLGALLGILAFPVFVSLSSGWFNQEFRAVTPPRIWLWLALALVTADAGGEILGVRQTTPSSRFLTGMVCGIVAAFYLLPPILEIFSRKRGRPRTARAQESLETR